VESAQLIVCDKRMIAFVALTSSQKRDLGRLGHATATVVN
jgi:hypothetical protein